MAAAGQTSLQRLLALDKTFDEFDDCIHAAADILSISLHDSAIVTSKVGGYSRFDFVLRWILDKLTKDAAIRGNPLAWSLLVRILTALPQNISSRLLVRSGLTATVIKTLDEHFGGLNVDAEKPANNQPTGAQISAKSEPTKSTKSKKRKRSDAVDAIPEVASQRNGIFTQLSRLFHTIALPSIDQHIVPFIRLWTHALITISGHAVGCNFSELERLLSAETHLLISLWTKNTRSMVRTEAHAAFAEEIAWPVSVFASQCSGLGINGPSLLLRQLLSKTYLRPSHDSYIKSSLSGKHTQISKDSVHAVFTSLSESIHQFMSVEGVSLQAREKVTVSVLSMLFDGIAGLKLQLAPREKRAHNKWTEAVFLELSSMIEKLSTHGDSHQLKKRLIKVMLDHIAHDVQALGNTILENISVNYTGLTHPPSTSEEASLLDLALIAQIIRLGPTVFNQGQQNPLLSLRNFLDNINLCLSREVGPESTEKEWARQIVVPLIQAQTQSQRVETFFQVWSDTLSTYDLAGAGPWRIWQEPEVRLALARLLELNLDINRSRLILDRATTDFVLSISKKPRGSGQKPLSIDTALLQIAVIVDVIRSDDTIDALREDFQRLLSLLVESFQTLLERETPRTHFWESLIRLHHHVAPDSDSIPDTAFLSKTVQEQTSCVEDAATLVLKATKKKTALTTDVLAALSYLLQTCTIGKELDVEIRLKAPSLEKLLTKHEDALTDAKCKEGLYAVTALLFPGRTSTSGLASELHNGVDGTHETGSELALDGIPEIVLDGWDQPLSQARVLSVLGLVKTCRDPRVFNASMHTLKPIVRDRDFKMNQLTIEQLLSDLHSTLSPESPLIAPSKARFIYSDICILLRSALQFYRPALGGRLHILLPALQQLLSCLFDPASVPARAKSTFQHPPWLTSPLRVHQAQLFARLVTMLCNPAPSTLPHHRRGGRAAQLTDPVRAARMHVADFASWLLGAFVRFRLQSAGGMKPEVREALAPAVDALFDVMDMAEGGDGKVFALSALMEKGEVALLETEHVAWKRRGRWRGA